MVTTHRQQFTAIYREHYSDVLAYMLRRAAPDEARDGAAEVFTVAWRRFGEMPVHRPLPWLYGVAARVLANHRRGTKRRAALDTKINGVVHPPEPTPDLVFSQAQSGSALFVALAGLSENDREILLLNAWEGLSASELAQRFDISAAAAQKRLARAKARLAEELDRDTAVLGDGRSRPAEEKGGPT